MEVADYRRRVDALKAQRQLLGTQRAQEQTALDKLTKELGHIEKAQALVQEAALRTQETLRVRLTSIVTTALRAVFTDMNLAFKITFETKRGRTECILEVEENGVPGDILETHGGGVADVVSFALRAAFWSIARTRPVLILDEPFKFINGSAYKENAADMLRTVSKKLGLQIIMVTLEGAYTAVADKTIRVSRKGNVSVAEEPNAVPSHHPAPVRIRQAATEGAGGNPKQNHR